MDPRKLAEFIIDIFEGGYGNDPADPGGETKYGISKRRYPNEDIPNMTKARAIDLFVKDFYNRFKAEILPMPTRLHYADMCFTGGGVRALQIACNELGYKPRLKTDNAMGKNTLKGMEWLAGQPAEAVYAAYLSGRLDHYRSIKGRPDSHYRSRMRRTSIMNMEVAKRLTPLHTPDGFFELTVRDVEAFSVVERNQPVTNVVEHVIMDASPEEFLLYVTVDMNGNEYRYFDGNKLRAKYKDKWQVRLEGNDFAIFKED